MRPAREGEGTRHGLGVTVSDLLFVIPWAAALIATLFEAATAAVVMGNADIGVPAGINRLGESGWATAGVLLESATVMS
jgi:hypothetical protein